MKTKNTKIQDYKTFEEIKTKSFKNMHNWSDNTPAHTKVELESTKIIVDKTKSTPSLNWLNDRGYSVVASLGEKRKGTLDNIGQTGVSYTFYLIPSWSQENYIEYLIDDWGFEDEDEVEKMFNFLGMDIDNLEIYGSAKGSEYDIKFDGQVIGMEQILDYYEENKERWDDVKKEVSIDYNIPDFNNNRWDDNYPFWGAKVPLKFNHFPSEDSKEYRVLCEYGLMMVKWEISKYLKINGGNSYKDMVRSGILDDSIIDRDTDMLIKYMNLSNVHVTKNEDIKMARDISYNIYQGSKLFKQNHEEARFKVSPEFVVRFMKESGNMDISKI